MEIDVSTQWGKVPVTVLHPHGYLDGSNYTELIDKVRKLVAEGTGDIVIDLGDVPYMSSAGLMAIHSATLMLRGEQPPSLESGKAAAKSIGRSPALSKQKHVKLVNPSAGVAETFDKVGFMQAFEIFADLQQAIASF
jgi:anti-anti-sigma regulatory factor